MQSPRFISAPGAAGGSPEFEAAYARLRQLAAGYVRRWQADSTLQATALVHEAYLKLARETREFTDSAHLVYTHALAMRQVLLDHARTRGRQKRGGQLLRVTLHDDEISAPQGVDVQALSDALDRLRALDERQARMVELRFFVGLSVKEAAQVLDISEKTVKRDWAMARAWLQQQLGA